MSNRYHINPETGEPGLCKATKQCRFGDHAHYGSAEEAREAYEVTQEALVSFSNTPDAKTKYAKSLAFVKAAAEEGEYPEDTVDNFLTEVKEYDVDDAALEDWLSTSDSYGALQFSVYDFARETGVPIPVAREELMHEKQVAHRVGPYFVSTRPASGIGAKPGEFTHYYETVVFEEASAEPPIFEDSSTEVGESEELHRQALAFAQARVAHPIAGLPIQMNGKLQGNDVVGTVDSDGFVASTYPSSDGFEPKPVRAVVSDPANGKSGFVAAHPHHGGGYLTHVVRDNPRWRQSMGLGKLVMYARPICKDSSTRSNAMRIEGGHNDPTAPTEALKEASSACTSCAKKYADPNFS